MDLLSEGDGLKQVAAKLDIKYNTVQIHVANVKAKAGVSGPVHRVIGWYMKRAA